MPSQPFSTEAYFQTQSPPAGLDEKAQRMDAFVQRWKSVDKARVVLVTSGGTTVPLESNTSAFILIAAVHQ
jgi:phosphopantothenate-cysteine ligase